MDQKEHIAMLQKQSREEASIKNQEIDRLFCQCLEADKEDLNQVFGEMMQKLREKYNQMVQNQLGTVNLDRVGAIEEVLQEAEQGVWRTVLRCRMGEPLQPSFAVYCGGIYRNKIADYMKEWIRESRNRGCSLDESLSEKGSSLLDLMEDKREKAQPQRSLEIKENQSTAAQVFRMFCQAMMESTSKPPCGLALYYARVAPHLLHLLGGEKTIPENKASSPKWARKRMGEKTVGCLSDDAERELKQYVAAYLVWCQAFRNQLEKTVVCRDQSQQILKDVIYTQEYTEDQVGHMADYQYAKVYKEVCCRVEKDPSLKTCIVAHVKKTHSRMYGGRGGKR